MNDEIKEYLDSANFKFKDVDEDGNEIELTLSEEIENLIDNNKRLADYITNLQQELKIMIKDDERSQETIIRLSKENERLKEWKNDLLNENIELENIRKEAIEYIKNGLQISILPNNQIINGKEVIKRINKIINILQNGSEEK